MKREVKDKLNYHESMLIAQLWYLFWCWEW